MNFFHTTSFFIKQAHHYYLHLLENNVKNTEILFLLSALFY